MLESTYEPTTRTLTCVLQGRLDGAMSSQLLEEIEARWAAVPDGDAKLVFEMSQVSYMASAFLRICMLMAKRMPLDRFSIIQCAPLVRKTFTMAGLDRVMTIQ